MDNEIQDINICLDNDFDGCADFEEDNALLKPDVYGIVPILVAKKKTYTEAHRRAQQKYREKFPEKYCELQRKLYDDKKNDPEWRMRYNERNRKNNKAYRERKKLKMEMEGIVKPPSKRGRPIKQKKIDDCAVPAFDDLVNNNNAKEDIVEKKKRGYIKKANPEIFKTGVAVDMPYCPIIKTNVSDIVSEIQNNLETQELKKASRKRRTKKEISAEKENEEINRTMKEAIIL
jgi:hypothetical protein